GFKREGALRLEVFRNGVGDVIILEIDVRAASFAHRRLRAGRHLQFGAAIETSDSLPFRLALRFAFGSFFDRFAGGFLDVEVTAALTAKSGKTRTRLRL